jgi:hypothetical protein
VKQYIKIFILYNFLGNPFSVSLPSIDVVDPVSLEPPTDEGERFASMVTGGYIVREIDTRGESGKVVKERPGTNRAVGWDWYVDKSGRNKVF